ncbi:Hypothetical_protein [Hexamita inflata]|uniref:Hypothetical_protein n=1 Tax=Hexamita inflata TaxID=28002 RepID=A0ABP1H869_9EUKA
MFIYAQATKSSDIQLEMQQVSQFAVFGFNTQKQDILDSDIFVTINYSILTGALICMQCDIEIQRSQLQFVAHGVQISALILKSLNTVQISKVNISFRFTSNFSSGLVNHINKSLTTFNISESILTGFNNYSSVSNGYICSKLSVDIHIMVASFSVCVENTSRFGSNSFTATQSQPETSTCTHICSSNYFVTYGLCQLQPQFSILLQNATVICEFPFVFNSFSNICECAFGYFLNITYCVNVIQQFSTVQKNATNLEIALKNEIQNTEIELKTAFIGLEQLIISNITALTKNMNDNDKEINLKIISVNETLHKNINESRAENTNKFSTLTGLIENKHILTQNQLTNVSTTLNNLIDVQTALIVNNQLSIKNNLTSLNTTLQDKLNSQMKLITDNQLNIKNNFTAQKDQITDFKSNVASTLNLMDAHITSFQNTNSADLTSVNTTLKNKFDTQTALITDNQLNIKSNFTAQKDQISSLKISIDTRFSTVDLSVLSANTKLDAMKTQIQSSQAVIETKIGGVSSLITNTVATQTSQSDMKTQITGVSNYITNNLVTQAQLKTVYDSLTSAINGISACKVPGSVNWGGVCKCVYDVYPYGGGGLIPVFCPTWNTCCGEYKLSDSMYDYHCYGISSQRISAPCPGRRLFTN